MAATRPIVRLAAAQEPAAESGHSVVVRRETMRGSAAAYDPFDEDDRLAQATPGQVVAPAGDPFADPFALDNAEQEAESGDAESTESARDESAESTEAPAAESPDAKPEDAPSPSDASDATEDSAEPLEDPAPEADPFAVEPPRDQAGPEADPFATEPPSNQPALPEATPEETLPTGEGATPAPMNQPSVGELPTPETLEGEMADELESAPAPVEPPTTDPLATEGDDMASELPTDPPSGAADFDGAPREDEPGDDEEPENPARRPFDYENLEEHLQGAPSEPTPIPPLTPAQQEARRRELEKERQEKAEDCREIHALAKRRNIGTISLDIRLQGTPGEDYPFECGLNDEQYATRSWSQITYLWKAAGLCHKPLYFEQPQLERYGHDWGPALQPVVSGAHFFATLPILPYKMGIETPGECIYTLGHYRPGSCAPYMIPAFPFTWRAAAFEAGAWTGGAFAIP